MNLRTRLWLVGGLALLGLIGLGMVLQLFNQLVWQLSTVLPYGLVGPVVFVIFAGAALFLVQLAWPWIRAGMANRSPRLQLHLRKHPKTDGKPPSKIWPPSTKPSSGFETPSSGRPCARKGPACRLNWNGAIW